MTQLATFKATFIDQRPVKSRNVHQFIFEVDKAMANAALQMLGGLPDPANPVWVAVARLVNGAGDIAPREAAESSERTPPPAPKPVRAPIAPDKRLTQRAAILCTDRTFQLWLKAINSAWGLMNLGTAEEKAAEIVRVYCGVKSRKEIVPGSQAARLWDEMLGKYEAWQACLEEVS